MIKKSKRLISLILAIFLLSTQVSFADEVTTSSAGGDFTFYATGRTSRTGYSNTDVNSNLDYSETGSSGTEIIEYISPATRKNNASNAAYDNFFSNLTMNNFSRVGDSALFVENIPIKRTDLNALLQKYQYDSSGDNQRVDTSDGSLGFGDSRRESLFGEMGNKLNMLIKGDTYGDIYGNGIELSSNYQRHTGEIKPNAPVINRISMPTMSPEYANLVNAYRNQISNRGGSYMIDSSGMYQSPIIDAPTLSERYQHLSSWLDGSFYQQYIQAEKEKWERLQRKKAAQWDLLQKKKQIAWDNTERIKLGLAPIPVGGTKNELPNLPNFGVPTFPNNWSGGTDSLWHSFDSTITLPGESVDDIELSSEDNANTPEHNGTFYWQVPNLWTGQGGNQNLPIVTLTNYSNEDLKKLAGYTPYKYEPFTQQPFVASVSMRDYCTVQHIVEYSISATNRNVSYMLQPAVYEDLNGGYYRWAIMPTDCSNPVFNGTYVTSDRGKPLSINANMLYRFNFAGVYKVVAKQNMKEVTVDALTYNFSEYWILAETGQVLYKRTSTGKMGTIRDKSGRQQDVNAAYFNAISQPAESNTGSYGIPGTIIREYTHTVTQDMIDSQFPAAGLDVNFGTARRS